MSKISSSIKHPVDENDTKEDQKTKKGIHDDVCAAVPKGVVLGNLQNRVLPRIKTNQHAMQKDLNNAKLNAMCEIKPRINCDRKKTKCPSISGKTFCPTTTTTTTTIAIKVTRITRAAVNPAPVKCSNSLTTQRPFSEEKTVTTKMLKNKLRQIRIVNNHSDGSNLLQKAEIAASQSLAVKSYSSMRAINVRNIDEDDKECLILVSEYANDIYDYLFHLEFELPIQKHHLAKQQNVTPKMRATLLDWISEVHSQCDLVTETFYIAVGIIDRYLQKTTDTKRTELQLVGTTALFLAAKYEELYAPIMADFIYITDHNYEQKQFLEMEIKIFKTLDWNLSHPVSIHFLRRFAKASNIDNVQYTMSKYFLELAAMEYKLASYKPSEIAASSLFLSLHMSKEDPKQANGFNDTLWSATLQHYSHYTAKHLRLIARKIAFIAHQAPKAKLNAVYRKYQSSKLYKISLNPVLYSTLMDSIIESKD